MSINKSLFGQALIGSYLTLRQYQLLFSRVEFESYYKFAFVRNPWDRLVSAYFFLSKGGFNRRDRDWAQKHLSVYRNFESFVKGWVNKKNVETWLHFRPQHNFIAGPRGELALDFVGRFERIAEDFEIVAQQIGLQSNLRHLNKTGGRRRDYRDYYTEETKQIVQKAYRNDIELFGYGFDD